MSATPQSADRAFIALWLPYLSTDRLRRTRTDCGAKGALVTTRTQGAGVFVAALDPHAVAAGITPGMTLASARSLCPSLTAVGEDLRADAMTLFDLAGWCDRYSPLVGTAGGDRVLIDVTGCTHLFGPGEAGPPAMLADVQQRLRRAGFAASVAYAPSPAAASALACYAGGGAGGGTVVARRQDLGERLKAVPVAALRLGEEAVGADALDGLQRVGLRRLGDLYGLPRAALAARFGAGVASALDRLLGHARQPIAPRRPASRYRVRLAFPDPIGQRGDIDAGVTRVVHHLCTRLEAEDLGCRHLLLQLWRADGTGQTIPLGFARPVRAPADILRLLAEKLGTVEPGFGIDCLILDAPRVEAFESTQLTAAMPPADGSLAGNKPSSPGLARGYADSDALASLADRLANRLGHDNLFRLSPTDSRLPDAAQTKRRPVARRGVPDKPGDWPQTAARPMSLLACPQPLMPLGAPKAGDPLLAFRYKGRRVAIRVAVGPERIAPDWWREDAAWAAGARDYWRVEDEEGQRFWIYRDAVAGPLADTAGTVGRQPWYLHGVFG